MFEKLDEILKENYNLIGFTTKIQIVENIKDLSETKEKRLSLLEKEKLLDYIYSFWIENEWYEHTLFDVCDLVFENIGNVLTYSYEDFYNKIAALM